MVPEAPMLTEIHFLRSNDVCSIDTNRNNVRHHCDYGVFLDIEWARIQRPGVAESLESRGGKDIFEEFTKWKRDKLNNKTRNEDARI